MVHSLFLHGKLLLKKSTSAADSDEIFKILTKAVEIQKKLPGIEQNSPIYGRLLYTLGSAHMGKQEYEPALEHLTTARSIMQQHPSF